MKRRRAHVLEMITRLGYNDFSPPFSLLPRAIGADGPPDNGDPADGEFEVPADWDSVDWNVPWDTERACGMGIPPVPGGVDTPSDGAPYG